MSTKIDQKVFFLEGGLGNQCAILAYTIKEKAQIKSSRISTCKYKTALEKRNYELDEYFYLYKIPTTISSKKADILYYVILRILYKLKLIKKNSVRYFGTEYVTGYFQEDMISSVEGLRPYLRLKPLKSKMLSIHVRRGDYIEEKHSNHGLVDVSCIKDIAIKVAKQEDLKILNIISEDPSVFKDFQVDPRFANFEIIDFTTCNQKAAFQVMLNSSHTIASNSTFSLVAGILSDGDLWIPDAWTKNTDSKFLGKKVMRYKAKFL